MSRNPWWFDMPESPARLGWTIGFHSARHPPGQKKNLLLSRFRFNFRGYKERGGAGWRTKSFTAGWVLSGTCRFFGFFGFFRTGSVVWLLQRISRPSPDSMIESRVVGLPCGESFMRLTAKRFCLHEHWLSKTPSVPPSPLFPSGRWGSTQCGKY